ncbi:MAG TPA: hypothetical protein VJ888_05385 [Mobilitalea sp.]|nr:hypothetical protein [Mobilitalea sp.]
MARMDFMKELESLLSDIPIEERIEALQYYNDYFEDAGADHEDEIIAELGSPNKVAGIIKADLSANGIDHENRGYYTEKGYQDTVYKDEKFELVNSTEKKAQDNTTNNHAENTENKENQQTAGTGNRQQGNNTNIALIILLAIFAIPIGFPLVIAFFSVAFAFMITILALVFSFGLAGIIMIIVGVALFILGIVQVHIPLALAGLCGSGLLVFGLGILFTSFSGLICKKLLPAMIKGIVAVCRIPFRNRSVAA